MVSKLILKFFISYSLIESFLAWAVFQVPRIGTLHMSVKGQFGLSVNQTGLSITSIRLVPNMDFQTVCNDSATMREVYTVQSYSSENL